MRCGPDQQESDRGRTRRPSGESLVNDHDCALTHSMQSPGPGVDAAGTRRLRQWPQYALAPTGRSPVLFLRGIAVEDLLDRLANEGRALVLVELHLDLGLGDAPPDGPAIGVQIEHQRSLFDRLE